MKWWERKAMQNCKLELLHQISFKKIDKVEERENYF